MIIENLTREVEVGDIFTGKVVKHRSTFGAFVEMTSRQGRDGSHQRACRLPRPQRRGRGRRWARRSRWWSRARTLSGKISLSRRMLLSKATLPTESPETASAASESAPSRQQRRGGQPRRSTVRPGPGNRQAVETATRSGTEDGDPAEAVRAPAEDGAQTASTADGRPAPDNEARTGASRRVRHIPGAAIGVRST